MQPFKMNHRELCATRVIISPWQDKTASHNHEHAPVRRQEVKNGKFHAEPQPSSKQPLHWKSSGAIFMPSTSFVENQVVDDNVVVKQDALLCKRVVDTHGEQPTQYNAREGRNQKEEWRQLQVELSWSTLSIYSTPALTWPSRELEEQLKIKHTPHLRLYLYSPLDYTFCVRYPYRNEYVTLTFRARSMTLSQEWYVALYRVLPDHCKPVCSPWCEVHIPLMDLSVRIPLVDKNTGELRYDITVRNIKDAVLALLEKDEAWATNIQSRLGKENLGMGWTRGSRTEWVYWTESLSDEAAHTDLVISPQHIEQTHRLELRRIEHTPNTIELSDETLAEPHPVEGFLYRMTTFSGKPIPPGSLSRRRFYFASFDQYLFCIHNTHALKPPSDLCYQKPLKPNDTSATVSPFTTPDVTESEIQRRLQLMTDASRVIDLTEVSHVSRSFNDEEDENHSALDVDDGGSLTAAMLHHPVSSPDQRQRNPCLEIVMQNGIVLKLKSDSSAACDAWVRHLSRLIVYWRAHKEASLTIHAQYDFSDMFDEDFRLSLTDAEKGSDFNRKPVVDTRIWSICLFDQCREVVKTGVMYFQPRSRGTFSQKIFILTADGRLTYYNIYDRAPITCQPILASIHDRKDSVDISSCYVYSSTSPRRPARIFPDGIAAADVNDDSLFCLWKPLTRRVFSPKRQRLCVYKSNSKFFQQDGETWQFLAKNRHEKEEWVWAINVVIEQLLRGKMKL